ncbi:MAG: hypothetical protein ABSB41_04955 [Anaerolineales bacterium]
MCQLIIGRFPGDDDIVRVAFDEPGVGLLCLSPAAIDFIVRADVVVGY